MSHITIHDIWDALLEADDGYIILNLPSEAEAAIIKRNLIKYKHRTLKGTPQIKDFIGDFKLGFSGDIQEGVTGYRLKITREDGTSNLIKIPGTIEVY